MQLHRHALSNSKRGIAVDENGKLDDEISVISSEVRSSNTKKNSVAPVVTAPSLTLTLSVPNSKTANSIKIALLHSQSFSLVKAGTPSKCLMILICLLMSASIANFELTFSRRLQHHF